MTIGQVKEINAGKYTALEVYEGDHFHTDSCSEVDEYSDNCIVKSWEIMGEEDYNNSLLANCGVTFDDIHEKGDKILCILITGKKEMFAILDVPYDYDFENEMSDHHIFEAGNMESINAELIRIGADDKHYSIEEYKVDEDGDFYEGSDYDSPSNFRKRTAANRTVKDICKMAGMTQNAMADYFCIPRRTFGNWCTGERECPIYTRLMMQEILGLFHR